MKFDSLIFDMDGTLWDAVDSYVAVWNKTFESMGYSVSVSRDDLLRYMGKPLDEIVESIASFLPSGRTGEFYDRLARYDSEMMPVLGGRLYPGVAEWFPRLAERYAVYMVSNCGPDGLRNFLTFTGLSEYVTDTLTNGETHLPKSGNIALLALRNGFKSPIYIGDTQGDCDQAHIAGIPMAHVTYGFGECRDADYSFSDFESLARFLLEK